MKRQNGALDAGRDAAAHLAAERHAGNRIGWRIAHCRTAAPAGWNWIILGDVDKDSLLAPITSARNTFLLLGLGTVILFALSFVVITRRWVSTPLQQVIHLAEQYADGNLQATLQTRRNDEIGQLIAAINGIGDGLARIVSQVRTAAQEISRALTPSP